MHKKIIPVLTILLLLLLPILTIAQQANYFPDRLIIKYQSEQKLQRIQSKSGINPRTAVQQMLSQQGMRTNKPLLSGQLRQAVQQRNLPSADDVLRIREISFNRGINPLQLAGKISSMPGVDYAEPKYLRKMSLMPDDPQLNLQKFASTHNFFDAWELSEGSLNINIAIIDGGVGYTHPELNDHLWINQDEVPPSLQPQVDQNGDGIITSTEIYEYLQQNDEDHNEDGSITLEDALSENSSFMDNVDSDNNGFADDLFGWDFWDAGGISNPIEDNNPIHDASDHGTHVAGTAAAETNNGTGISGAAFNTSYMTVKAGGIPDDPATEPDESNAIGFGFEGMIYAAQNGADIINCSWGGNASSEAEQEIISLTTEMGTLVVAAAGNASNSPINYPASYENVLSVGAISTNGSVAQYSNFGYQLDVLAVGTEILSTSFDGDYDTKSGTSMATPVISGLAGLVREDNPGWSPERIAAQIRASASYIDAANASTYDNQLGHGSADAFAALNNNLPGLKVVSQQFLNTDGEKLSLNEPGSVQITLTNVGNTASGVELQLESLNENGLELGTGTRQLGSIATGDTAVVSFNLSITSSFDLNETPTLRLNFEDSGSNYDDFRIIQYQNFLYDILAANNVLTSFAADGTVGFTNPLNQSGGVGFIPINPDGTEGDNLLFEGGLMIEINGEIYDAVRSPDGLSRDFIPRQVFATEPTEDRNGARGYARFATDVDTARQAIIGLETFAFDEPAISNAVLVEYTIQNPAPFLVMEDVYAGLFNDWDIGDNASNNNISYNEADSVLYISDAAPSDQPVVAVAHLSPISGALAIDNTAQGQADSLIFGIYDGFTDAEKSNALTSGTERTSVQNTDVSAVTASGPYTINPGAQVRIGFIYAFGDDIAQLRNQIEEARSQDIFAVSPTGTVSPDAEPEQTKLFQNYPNPFRSSTRFRIDLQQTSDVTLTIYNVLGRKVRVIVDEEFQAGSYFISFEPDKLSSGVYYARLKTEQGMQTIPMTLVK